MSKKDIVQEEKTDSAPVKSVEVLSQQDSQVANLVKEQPSAVEVEGLASVKDISRFNLLELPEECKPLHRVKYRYRWLAKDKNLEARLRSSVWVLCTRSNSPYIKPHRFKSHGAVEQAGMLLAFCTEEVGRIREEAPAKRSADLVKHYTKDLPNMKDRGFYSPDTSVEKDDDAGLVEGRDF